MFERRRRRAGTDPGRMRPEVSDISAHALIAEGEEKTKEKRKGRGEEKRKTKEEKKNVPQNRTSEHHPTDPATDRRGAREGGGRVSTTGNDSAESAEM